MASPEVTQLLRDRALVSLRSQLRAQRQNAVRGVGDDEDLVAQARREGRLLAMERAGAITGEEAAWWRGRLLEAATWRESEMAATSATVTRRAEAHLEGLLVPLSAGSREESSACFNAIAAYQMTGLLTPDEALRWRERVRVRLGLEPERPPRSSYRSLARVLQAPSQRIHGLRITSAELYEDGVILRWHYAWRWVDGPDVPRVWSVDDMDVAGDAEIRWRGLTDDSGTRYFGHPREDFGINGSGWIVRFGQTPCTPAVPAHARQLRARFDGGSIDIDL